MKPEIPLIRLLWMCVLLSPPALAEPLLECAPYARPSSPFTPPTCAPIVAGERLVESAELPLSLWNRIQAELRKPPPARPLPRRWAPIARRLEGALEAGLLEATLTLDFEILTPARVTLPILDEGASLMSARLDGQPVALRRQGGLYHLQAEGIGVHRVQIKLLLGETQARAPRALSFALPAAGPTAVDLRLAEAHVRPALRWGRVQATPAGEGWSRLTGELGNVEGFNLSWAPLRAQPQALEPRWRIKLDTLFMVNAALTTGVSHADIQVDEGALDQLELRLPEGLEVLGIDGDQVLQWRLNPPEEGQESAALTVLLKAPVGDALSLSVRFQLPVEEGGQVLLRLPVAPEGIPCEGHAGVVASSGLELRAGAPTAARALEPLKLPSKLSDMSATPLLFGFAHDGAPPQQRVHFTRNAQVDLTDSVIDELDASSVVLLDGYELTKVKLRMRNNTRQYLSLKLPEGARLQHALMDGVAFRPAVAQVEGEARLLVPLKQSRKLSGDEVRKHVVRPNENLGSIAYIYYSNPQRWEIIREHNGLSHENDLYEGQVLEIPPLKGVTVEEVRFVVELSYERDHGHLGWIGAQRVDLPTLDVPALKATWHVYLPEALEAVQIQSNLVQYSAVRYDPFRRARDFLKRALGGGEAWAGGYRSILKQRRGIYAKGAAEAATEAGPLSTIPLVGERLRFKRLLLGVEAPTVTIGYLSDGAAVGLRALSLLISALLTLFALWPRRRLRYALLALLPYAGLLVLGYYVIGINRRLVWGADLALIALLLWHGLPALKARLDRGGVRGLARFATPARVILAFALAPALGFALEHPMFLSLTALAALGVTWAHVRWSLRCVD